jgi:hypothetical protein
MPLASTRQMLVTYFFRSELRICTLPASQLPSGDSRSAVTRGMATYSRRSWKEVGTLVRRAGQWASVIMTVPTVVLVASSIKIMPPVMRLRA